MWYLIVIFISASINLSLIKIFPQVLADYSIVFNHLIRDKWDRRSVSSTSPSTSPHEPLPFHCNDIVSECVATRQIYLFTVACKDFYDRLSNEQKVSFRDIFSNLKEQEIYNMLKTL